MLSELSHNPHYFQGYQQTQWMPLPETMPGCPPGLEYLTQLDQLLVHQQVELFEGIWLYCCNCCA